MSELTGTGGERERGGLDEAAPPLMSRKSARLGALREFVATENASAVIMLAATTAALLWANSPWGDSYDRFWNTELALRVGDRELALDARHWINDGLMTFFFLVVGLEIRREFDMGELRERRRVATPVVAAVGGMVAPALIFLAINAGEPSARGWGIAMGTDTAFALGILTLVGGASPRVRTFLLTAVVIDDIVALAVIALAYTEDLSWRALLVAVGLLGIVVALRRAEVRDGRPYFVIGVGVWLATLASGVHATLTGIAFGLLATAHPPSRADLQQAGTVWRLFRETPTAEAARTASRSVAVAISVNERLQQLFHPWTSFLIVPVFALANAGVALDGEVLRRAAGSPITIGVVVGLVVGKPLGITSAAWLATRPRLGGFPLTISWPRLVGVATVAGVGFTISLLIADIAFDGSDLEEAKVGILSASVLAASLSWVVFRVIDRLPSDRPAAGTAVPEILDLAEPIDPEVDHLRGPADAPVTVVEYGDFECPYCGRAEPIVRELVRTFGDDLTFVFRHLPLPEVHEHARLAAEAAEAAGAQGRFWEMHDAFFAHQGALTEADLIGYARGLGLDVDRFVRDLHDRRHALRVDRDIASADDSGAAGTPTFFINGHRHQGPPSSLAAALRYELEATRPAPRAPASG
jgi:Na+/H+ antiporter NhaA